MDTEKQRRYVALVRRKRALDAQKREVEQQLAPLESEILSELASEGVARVTVEDDDGECTLYGTTRTWAKPKEGVARADVVRALEEAELSDMLGYNANSLSAYVRERVGDGLDGAPGLQPELAAVLDVCETTKLSARIA